MSSNIKVQRICQYCANEFIARTTVTRFCSHACARHAYKKREKVSKTTNSNAETLMTYTRPPAEVKLKEFLTVREVAALMNCSVRTAYYAIKSGTLNSVNLGQRITRVKRSEIDKLFEQKIASTPLSESKIVDVKEGYTLAEVQSRFGISEKGLHSLIERNKIPKMKQGKFVFVPKNLIDNLLN
jgi:excisionase family DNA binding protein